MARRVPCARATRGLRKPSLDARSWGLILAILEKVNEQAITIVSCLLRPCLGQGASWRARVGQVRRLAGLSIPQNSIRRPESIQTFSCPFTVSALQWAYGVYRDLNRIVSQVPGRPA